MFKRLGTPNIIRRLSHTHSKTIFPDNNKVIEDLIKQQNTKLEEITHSVSYLGLAISILTVVIAWKPVR